MIEIQTDYTQLHCGWRGISFYITTADLTQLPSGIMAELGRATLRGRTGATLRALATVADWLDKEQEERNPMSWHTILEDENGVTVEDLGHHPFTSAGLFFKALDGDFRVKIHGQNAGDLAPILSDSIDTMDEDPAAFKEFEGPLGSLDGARAYLVSLRVACLAHPTATVRVIGDNVDHTTARHAREESEPDEPRPNSPEDVGYAQAPAGD